MTTRSGIRAALARASFGNVSCSRVVASAVKSTRLHGSREWVENSAESGGRERWREFSQPAEGCQANREVITNIYDALWRVVNPARGASPVCRIPQPPSP